MSAVTDHAEGLHANRYVDSCYLCRRRDQEHHAGPTLFDQLDPKPPPLRVEGAKLTLLQRFEQFFRARLEVWERFEAIALENVALGRQFGAKEIWEQLRREPLAKSSSGQLADGFKLPNDFPSYYARVFLARHPSAWLLLKTRRSRGEEELRQLREVLRRCLELLRVEVAECSCGHPIAAGNTTCADCRRS